MTRTALALAMVVGSAGYFGSAWAHGGNVGVLRCHRVAESAAQHCHDAAPERPPYAGADSEFCDNWRLQRCLALLGYDPGPVDGHYGRQTRAGWRAYADEFERGVEIRSCSGLTAPDALACKQ